MKASELRDLGAEELRQREAEFKEELFNLRFQHGTGQLESPMRIKAIKRDLARVLTILNERKASR